VSSRSWPARPKPAAAAGPTPDIPGEGPSPMRTRELARVRSMISRNNHPCPIVGMGASAGGFEAFQKFFAHMPPDTGLGLALVQHLAPPTGPRVAHVSS